MWRMCFLNWPAVWWIMTDGLHDTEREQSAIRNYPLLLRRYARLLEVTTDLASVLELGTLLQRIVDAAQELTGSQAASLLLYDPQTHHLYFEAVTNAANDGMERTAVPAENSIAGWVFTRGEPLVVDSTGNDPRFFREVDLLTNFHTQSVLGVPLTTKDKILGVIEAVNKLNGAFGDEDVRLLQALASQAAVALENSRLFQQNDVVAEIVHELRTPLTALTAAAHLLARGDLPEEQRRHLGETISSEVTRLNEMATDFLELTRLESGRARLAREPIHLGGLIGECLEIVRPQAQSEHIEINTEVDPSLTTMTGDRARLKQVLLNLLSNAIKYNKSGGSVSITARRLPGQVILTVSDSGRGIGPESLPHLFERFYRVPGPDGLISGTGLGLAIAKRIVESHGGQITVESSWGQGTSFIVTLPLSQAAAPDNPAAG
jgi:signal transduction histidine kinase